MKTKKIVERKLIPANLDKNILIKEDDKGSYHVELVRRTMVPGRDEPIFNSFVQCFDIDTWHHMQTLDGSNGADWKKAALVYRFRVVHNPLKNS